SRTWNNRVRLLRFARAGDLIYSSRPSFFGGAPANGFTESENNRPCGRVGRIDRYRRHLPGREFHGSETITPSAGVARSRVRRPHSLRTEHISWQGMGRRNGQPLDFYPTQFDAGQWMTAIKSAGVRYVVMVAKHHDGFCLWPTNQTEYSVKSSSWKNGQGDVVGEVAAAARKHGLKLGIYLSPWDRHERRYANSAEYDNYYLAEMDELIQHYGELVEWWLDGAGGAGHVYTFSRYIEELRTYIPDTLVLADMP